MEPCSRLGAAASLFLSHFISSSLFGFILLKREDALSNQLSMRIDRLRVGWLESRRCSRDTYQESYTATYTGSLAALKRDSLNPSNVAHIKQSWPDSGP